MPKLNDQVVYDEASSSDDDSSSSSSEEDSSSNDEKNASIELSKSDELHDESDDDDDDDDDEPKVIRDTSINDDAGNESEDDLESLPLHERVKRKEQKGTVLKEKRERKRNALELASERLRKYRNPKAKKSTPDDPQPKRKKSKHAPTEVSSRRADFFQRGAMRLNESGLGVEIGANTYKPMDPRTSSLSGHLNEEAYEKNYAFLQDLRTQEIANLKKQIAARKQTGKKGQRMRNRLNVPKDGTLEEDEERLKKLKQEKTDFQRRQLNRAAQQSVRNKMKQEVAEGKRGVYFLKRKEKRKLEFEAKMEELRKRGGHKAVEKMLARRRQKAKSRDSNIFTK